MAQLVKALASKLGNLSSIPRFRMVKENWLTQVFLWSLHVPICVIPMYTYMYTHTNTDTVESMWCRFSFCSWGELSGLDFPSVFLPEMLCQLPVSWLCHVTSGHSAFSPEMPLPHTHILCSDWCFLSQLRSIALFVCLYLSEISPTTKPNRMKCQFLLLPCILRLSVLDLSLRMFITCSLGFLTVLPAPSACVPVQHTLEALQCLQKGGRELLQF